MTDVFVIGGGPAGLAAAIAARRRGLRVMLADALLPPIDKACGEGLMPDGLAALTHLGVQLPPGEAFPFRGIRMVAGGHMVDGSFPNGPGLGVRRTILHRTMVEHAQAEGVEMLWGVAVSGIRREGVEVNGAIIPARWIVGADGRASRVRKWSGLDAGWRQSARTGFRRHYRIEPWTDCMEIHWGPRCQVYITPVAADEVCVALISRDPGLRLDAALRGFPYVQERLDGAPHVTVERGSPAGSFRLRRVYRGNLALIGDASGCVDAISGEGLHLVFTQSLALADAIAASRLDAYASLHRQIRRRPAFMARVMLALEESPGICARAIRTLGRRPDLFANMLAFHVGETSPLRFAALGAALGAGMLTP